MRQEFSTKVKTEAALRANGHCERCGTKLMSGMFHYDHIIPDGLGGEPTTANCAVVCKGCHGEKTAKQDVPQIAKMKRQRAKHLGIRKHQSRPLPGTRASGWKQKMDGTWERRT